MPKLVEGSEVSTILRPELAQKWGMTGEVVIAGGAGDNAAAAIGLGLRNPSDGFVSLGTSGVVFQITDGFLKKPTRQFMPFAMPCRIAGIKWG